MLVAGSIEGVFTNPFIFSFLISWVRISAFPGTLFSIFKGGELSDEASKPKFLGLDEVSRD